MHREFFILKSVWTQETIHNVQRKGDRPRSKVTDSSSRRQRLLEIGLLFSSFLCRLVLCLLSQEISLSSLSRKDWNLSQICLSLNLCIEHNSRNSRSERNASTTMRRVSISSQRLVTHHLPVCTTAIDMNMKYFYAFMEILSPTSIVRKSGDAKASKWMLVIQSVSGRCIVLTSNSALFSVSKKRIYQDVPGKVIVSISGLSDWNDQQFFNKTTAWKFLEFLKFYSLEVWSLILSTQLLSPVVFVILNLTFKNGWVDRYDPPIEVRVEKRRCKTFTGREPLLTCTIHCLRSLSRPSVVSGSVDSILRVFLSNLLLWNVQDAGHSFSFSFLPLDEFFDLRCQQKYHSDCLLL